MCGGGVFVLVRYESSRTVLLAHTLSSFFQPRNGFFDWLFVAKARSMLPGVCYPF